MLSDTIFSLPFMQRAFLAALAIGLAAPAIGTYLVQRRLALMGDGLGHVALTGVGLGLITHTSPVWGAVLVAVGGSAAVELIRERAKASGDVALAMLFYGGLAGGSMLISLSGGNANLNSYLFGSILSTSDGDLWAIAALAVGVLLVTLGLRRALFAVCQDEEFARVAGLPVRALNLLLAVTTAVTVTVGHARGRGADGQRLDGGAGGRRAAADAGFRRHDGRRDGDRGRGRVLRRHHVVLRGHAARRLDRADRDRGVPGRQHLRRAAAPAAGPVRAGGGGRRAGTRTRGRTSGRDRPEPATMTSGRPADSRPGPAPLRHARHPPAPDSANR